MTGSAIELTFNHWSSQVPDVEKLAKGNEAPNPEFVLRPAWQRIGVCTAHMFFGAGVAAALLVAQTRFVRTLAIIPPSGNEGRRLFLQCAHNLARRGMVFPLSKCTLGNGRNTTELILRVAGERGHWYIGFENSAINGNYLIGHEARAGVLAAWNGGTKGKKLPKPKLELDTRWKSGPTIQHLEARLLHILSTMIPYITSQVKRTWHEAATLPTENAQLSHRSMAPENNSDEGFKQVQRHPQFYLLGGDVHFLVDNQLFRVHRYFFERESRVFREKIHVPPASGGPRDGDDESVAILLEDVSAFAFERLLGVFYNPRYSLFDWAIEDWTSVLELTQKWEFKEVHNLAIRELEKQTQLPLIERIVLYQRFDVDRDLLVPLYGKLCSRPEALDDDESEAIGIKATVLVFRARETLRARPSDGGLSPLPAGLEDSDVHRTLATLLDSTTSAPTSPVNQSSSRKGKQPERSGQGPPKNANGRTGRHVGPSLRS
ncbi:hypothetical protein DXG01_010110 [Tephrocybe rancida]|nr:hypothetical protein DXG01_010110 [Tephrocybe rancida]